MSTVTPMFPDLAPTSEDDPIPPEQARRILRIGYLARSMFEQLERRPWRSVRIETRERWFEAAADALEAFEAAAEIAFEAGK